MINAYHIRFSLLGIGLLVSFWTDSYSQTGKSLKTGVENILERNNLLIESAIDSSLREIQILMKAKDSIRLRYETLNLKPSKRELQKNRDLDEQIDRSYQAVRSYDLLLAENRRAFFMNPSDVHLTQKKFEKQMISILKADFPKIVQKNSNPLAPMIDNSGVKDFQIWEECDAKLSEDGKLKSTNYKKLFYNTDPKLEKYFPENDFIECYARVIKSKKNWFLDLKLILANQKVLKLMGNLSYDVPIKLIFMDGDFIYLRNISITSPVYEAQTGRSSYKIQVTLDREKVRKLRKKEIDQIVMVWSSGIEQYEVYDFSIIKRMIACLEQRN